jgi:hypothetical protein
MSSLNIDGLVDHFIKRNVLDFFETKYDASLNSTISGLSLPSAYNLNLDSKLLNPQVFMNLNQLHVIYGTIKSIEVDLFGKLPRVWYLEFGSSNFASFFHNLGFEWMQSLNPRLKKNININDYLKNFNYDNTTQNHILSYKKVNVKYTKKIESEHIQGYKFPDEDFCLFLGFPHNRLVFPILDRFNYTLNCSCTLM